MKKVLITGASGFAGTHLYRHLLHQKWEVEGTYYELPAAGLSKEMEWHQLDITHYPDVERLLNRTRPDSLCHLAALSVPRRSWDRPTVTFQTNVLGTLNLLKTFRKLRLKSRFLFISTTQVYGESFRTNAKIQEDTVVMPENPYAASKALGELACLNFNRQFGIDTVIARPFNHVGTGQSQSLVFSDWCRQIAEMEIGKRKPVLHTGNLEVSRDFLNVNDIVRAYQILLEKGKSGEIYNVASQRSRPLKEYLDQLKKLSKVPFRVRLDPAKLRTREIQNMSCSSEKIRKLGWNPVHSVFDALNKLLHEWRMKVIE